MDDISDSLEADELRVNGKYILGGVLQQGSSPIEAQTTDSTSESSVQGRSQNDGDKTHQVVDTLEEDSVEANRGGM